MKVYEARALVRRVADDMDAAHTVVRDALNTTRNGLIQPHAQHPGNEVYAGEGAGNVALRAEQQLDAAYRKAGVLLRSLEVIREEIHAARKAARDGAA